MKKFHNLEFKIRNLTKSLFSGIHHSSNFDSLIEVDTVRDYQPGDRKLDSRASIKSSRTMTRTFNPEKDVNIVVLLDCSASMEEKKELQFYTALFLRHICDYSGNKFGLFCFNDKIIDFNLPTNETKESLNLLEKHYGLKNKGSTNVEKVVNFVSGYNFIDTYYFIISDFYFNFPKNLLKLSLGKTNKVICLMIVDEKDWEIPNLEMNLQDSENKGRFYLNKKSNNSTWLESTKSTIKYYCCEPVVIYDSLNPLVKFLLRN